MLQLGVLVKLLDSFLMPDDLPPIGEGDEYVYSLPGRKDDKQLHRLALANAEAEGASTWQRRLRMHGFKFKFELGIAICWQGQ